MRSGVSRARVRSRFFWRMISWPAANEMRWVKPSIATVSRSRTMSRTASAIEATLLVDTTSGSQAVPVRVRSAGGLDPRNRPGRLRRPQDRLLGRLAGHVGDGLREDPERGRHLGL